MDDIVVSPELTIPAGELSERFSRSGGPGGQHVNVTASRVELLWSVAASAALTDAQRARLLAALASRLDGDGVLRIVVVATRSQQQNRALAAKRLAAVVAAALRPRKSRRATRPTAAAREERLAAKRRRGDVKRARQAPPGEGAEG